MLNKTDDEKQTEVWKSMLLPNIRSFVSPYAVFIYVKLRKFECASTFLLAFFTVKGFSGWLQLFLNRLLLTPYQLLACELFQPLTISRREEWGRQI